LSKAKAKYVNAVSAQSANKNHFQRES